MIAVADVLKTIAEDKSLLLFNTIALSNSDSDILMSTLRKAICLAKNRSSEKTEV